MKPLDTNAPAVTAARGEVGGPEQAQSTAQAYLKVGVGGGGKKPGGLVTILNQVMPKARESAWNKQEKLVAIAIAAHLNSTVEAWPTVMTIARMSGVCRDSVHKALKQLCGPNGIFERRRRGRGASNLYVVSPRLMSDYPDISGATSEPPRPTGTLSAGSDSDSDSDSSDERGTNPPERDELSSETLLRLWPPDPPARRSRSKRVVAKHPNLVPELIAQLRDRLSKASLTTPNDDVGTREWGA